MEDEPKGGGVLGIIAMGVCCGLPLLLFSGVLSGFGAWFADGGYVTVLLAVFAGVVVIYVWRRLSSPANCEVTLNTSTTDTNEKVIEK